MDVIKFIILWIEYQGVLSLHMPNNIIWIVKDCSLSKSFADLLSYNNQVLHDIMSIKCRFVSILLCGKFSKTNIKV